MEGERELWRGFHSLKMKINQILKIKYSNMKNSMVRVYTPNIPMAYRGMVGLCFDVRNLKKFARLVLCRSRLEIGRVENGHGGK